MRILLYIIAVLLVIIWAIGFFAYDAGTIIHLLPVLSIFLILQGFMVERELLYLKKNPTWKVQE
jgi:ABC-type maltose transport system permease subunit